MRDIDILRERIAREVSREALKIRPDQTFIKRGIGLLNQAAELDRIKLIQRAIIKAQTRRNGLK